MKYNLIVFLPNTFDYIKFHLSNINQNIHIHSLHLDLNFRALFTIFRGVTTRMTVHLYP